MEQGKALGVIIDFTRIDTPWTRARTLIYEGKLVFYVLRYSRDEKTMCVCIVAGKMACRF
jgi:hypothetical protein